MVYKIEIENLWWKYETSEDWILRDINLKIKEGEFLVITGPNDHGKSTLCLTMNSLIPNSFDGVIKGKVTVSGMNTREHPIKDFASKIGVVSQDFESQFISVTVEDEVSFGLENLALPPPEISERIEWALKVVKMEKYLSNPPQELSGGQKQRVAIAAALAMKPEILVLDEPTSQLDPVGKAEVYSVIEEMKKEANLTIIVVEHRMEFVAALADRFILLNKGAIILEGGAEEFFRDTNFLREKGVRPPQMVEVSDYIRKECDHKPEKTFLTSDQAYNWIVESLGKKSTHN